MTESEKLDPEPAPEPEPELNIKTTGETEPTSTKPQIKIETLEDLRDVMIISKGGDPKASQTINDFMKFDNNTERSNFPNTKTTLCIAQLNGFSQLFYPNDDNNPFALVAGCIEVAFMARKGWKSDAFVEMVKQTPTIPDMVTIGERQKRGIGDRLLGSGKE